MKKVLLAITLAFSLAGCAQLQKVSDALHIATAGTANPVTKQDLYIFENGMIVAFAGLNAYKRACVAEAVDTNCKANISAMQVYTRQLPAMLKTVRAFVKNNDQVNAAIAFNTLKDLYSQFKALAITNGVKVQ